MELTIKSLRMNMSLVREGIIDVSISTGPYSSASISLAKNGKDLLLVLQYCNNSASSFSTYAKTVAG